VPPTRGPPNKKGLRPVAITYPLALPEPMPVSAIEIRAKSVVGVSRSPFTGHSQIYRWPGQWWEATITLPPMHWHRAKKWAAWFLALNGPEGTFNVRLDESFPRSGTAGHGWNVGASMQVGDTWLPLTPLNGGGGVAAVGDFLYIAAGTGSHLHRVLSVETDGSGVMTGVHVFPRLRGSWVNHSLTFVDVLPTFRLAAMPSESYDVRRICEGLSFEIIDAAGM